MTAIGVDVCTGLGTLRIASVNHHKLGRRKEGSHLRAFGESVALRHLDFGLVASRTVREYVSILKPSSLW